MTKKKNKSRSKTIHKTKSYSRSEIRYIAGRVRAEVHRKLKILAVEQDKSIQLLLEEALRLLFKKYDKLE